MRFRNSILAFLMVIAAAPSAARAGQVRVDVGPGFSSIFSPQNVTVNQGDHVVWVWKSGSHSVTQGANCSSAGAFFNSSQHTNWTFAWKADRLGAIPYFCIPHCNSGMTGNITVTSADVASSAFRMTEISRTNEHTNDYVEVTNLGDAPGNLGRYRLALAQNAGVIQLNDLIVPVGGSVIVHMGVSGTDTQTDVYLESVTLPALYSITFMVAASANVEDPSFMLDYVEVGADARFNELEASSAGFWSVGQFLPIVAAGHALEFCGTATQYGPAFWRDTATPSPGTHVNCGVPVEATTWGGVKSLRR